jgi:hypothetical protein
MTYIHEVELDLQSQYRTITARQDVTDCGSVNCSVAVTCNKISRSPLITSRSTVTTRTSCKLL